MAAWSSGNDRSIRARDYTGSNQLIVSPVNQPSTQPQQDVRASALEALTALFALGREVTSVLDLEELLQKIPELISRITKFKAFAVYLLDPKRNELTIAYSVGYPAEVARTLRVKVGDGLVGAAVADGQPLLVNNVHLDPRYVEAVPGSNAELVVPLKRKGRVIGALNLLSQTPGQFTETDLDELLTRIANLTRRVIDYRTFGILLLNEETEELEMKVAVRYGDNITVPRVKLGNGLVGYAALHKEPVLVAD